MLKAVSRARLAGAWCAAVVAIGACGVVAGVAVSISAAAWLLVACLVPPAVMMLVWRGAPLPTVAELLYAVDKPSKADRP
jgi:hypothetical protein